MTSVIGNKKKGGGRSQNRSTYTNFIQNSKDALVRVCNFKAFQFEFCFVAAFSNKFRSFVKSDIFVGFGDS